MSSLPKIRLLPYKKGCIFPLHMHCIGTTMSKRTLEPCLLPEAAWGKSLCNLNKQGCCKYWPGIRDEAVLKHGTACVFCSNTYAHGHEIWEHDDLNAILTLKEVVPVCEMCHNVIHMGRSELLASQGQLDFKKLITHFAEVRGIKRFEIEAICRQAFDTWEVRSRKTWRIDYGSFAMFVHAPGGLPDISVFDDFPVVSDEDRLPSQTGHVKWLSVKKGKTRLHDEEKVGTFVLSGPYVNMDLIWPRVAKMTLAGSLGEEAYASTAQYRETDRLLRDKGVIGVVLGHTNDFDEIERMLRDNFARVSKIVYKKV